MISLKPIYRPSIFLAIPTLGVVSTAISVRLLQWVTSGKYRIKYFPLENVRPIDKARNVCHREFLKEDYDYLFFLDGRVVPQVDVLDKLIAANKDIVSSTVQALQAFEGAPRLVPVAMRKAEGGFKPHFGEGLERVDATTMACTLIKRKVMEAVGKRAFQHTMIDEWGTTGYSEDFYFCERARGAGFEIWNDYTQLASHFKETDMRTINSLMAIAYKEGKDNG